MDTTCRHTIQAEMAKIPRILMGEINKSVFFRFFVMIDQTADAPVRDATKHHALCAPEAGVTLHAGLNYTVKLLPWLTDHRLQRRCALVAAAAPVSPEKTTH